MAAIGSGFQEEIEKFALHRFGEGFQFNHLIQKILPPKFNRRIQKIIVIIIFTPPE